MANSSPHLPTAQLPPPPWTREGGITSVSARSNSLQSLFKKIFFFFLSAEQKQKQQKLRAYPAAQSAEQKQKTTKLRAYPAAQSAEHYKHSKTNMYMY